MTVEDQKFVTALVQSGVLARDRVRLQLGALDAGVREKGLARALVATFKLTEDVVAGSLCSVFSFPRMSIAAEIEAAPEQLFTEDELRTFRIMPVFLIGLELTIAFTDPPSRKLLLELQRLSGYRVIPVFTTISDFEDALKRYRGTIDRVQSLRPTVALEEYDTRRSQPQRSPMQPVGTSEASIAQLMDEVLLRAVKAGASDIHIEPADEELTIRFRIDGVLQRVVSLPLSQHPGAISVIKSKAGMDMFERAIPQDGRMELKFADRLFDVRVNSLPLLNGEKIVMRLLGKTSMIIDLDNLGFSPRNLQLFRTLLKLPNGVILVTGPTGSGKTTTLYSALNEIKGITTNITTVENPVEYKLPLINQVQVAPERGLTFASALRAILRQDPNIILVGEIRDSETGMIATEAALTGHLVLSTLHTNDAIGAISRMVNLGIASFWVSASVIGVVSQRLIRKICARCKEEYRADDETIAKVGLGGLPKGTTLYRGKGCAFCTGTGYKGRTAIHEVFVITEEMRDIIYGEVTTSKLRQLAVDNNFRDMFFDGLQKALAGITTVEEVQRVTRRLS